MFWFMLLMNLLIPLTMVFLGIYFKKAALPEINPLFGYRTRRSMASLETWQFSNRLMGSYWFKYGLALSMITIIFSFLLKDQIEYGSLFIMLVQMCVMFYTVYLIEKALKQKFGN